MRFDSDHTDALSTEHHTESHRHLAELSGDYLPNQRLSAVGSCQRDGRLDARCARVPERYHARTRFRFRSIQIIDGDVWPDKTNQVVHTTAHPEAWCSW